MSYTEENQRLEGVTKDLKGNLKDFRERAENRIMNTDEWDVEHRLKLKQLVDTMFDLQIKLHNL